MSDSDDDEPPTLVNLGEEGEGAATTASASTSAPAQDASLVVNDDKNEGTLPPCPVTILSGFLGSGKTTLIQYILKSPDHKKRIAVIENEFGEGLSIESLIAKDGMDPSNQSNLTDLVELPNGCVCCTVKDSLVATLEALLAKRKDLDYILIEASGMANPGPIASVFWLDDELDSRLQLDGVVTLVDSYHVLSQLEETAEASQQIAYADRILLNKTDLVESAFLEKVQATVQAINPAAHMQSTSFSQIPDLDWILEAKVYDKKHKTQEKTQEVEQLISVLNEQQHSPYHGSHDHSHGHEHNHGGANCLQCQQQQAHTHTGAVSTIALKEEGTMDWSKVNSWLASTLWPNQDEKDKVLRARLEEQLLQDKRQANGTENSSMEKEKSDASNNGETSNQQQQIYRMKGILSMKHNPETIEDEEWLPFCDSEHCIDSRQYILQGVYDLWEVYPSSEKYNEESSWERRSNKLIIIGRHLQREELRQGFQSCLVRTKS